MNAFGWDLPPGATQREIDEQVGDGDEMGPEEIEDARAEKQFQRDYEG